MFFLFLFWGGGGGGSHYLTPTSHPGWFARDLVILNRVGWVLLQFILRQVSFKSNFCVSWLVHSIEPKGSCYHRNWHWRKCSSTCIILQPSHDAISTAGAIPLAQSFDTMGKEQTILGLESKNYIEMLWEKVQLCTWKYGKCWWYCSDWQIGFYCDATNNLYHLSCCPTYLEVSNCFMWDGMKQWHLSFGLLLFCLRITVNLHLVLWKLKRRKLNCLIIKDSF